MRLQRPKHKPVAVHRVARGNDYPTAHAVRAALASPEYTRIPATATVLRGAIPPRDVSPGAPFAPFRPEDCAPPSPACSAPPWAGGARRSCTTICSPRCPRSVL